MIKKALEYIVGMSAPSTMTIDGHTYSDKTLYRIIHNPYADAIQMNTLSSLVDYIKSGIDEMKGNMIIHIKSPTRVEMYSALDRERNRECIAKVDAIVPQFKFDQFIDHEKFCINVQSKFEDTLDRALLLKFAGTVEAGTVAQYGDDGITQKATVKTGIFSKGDALVPNPVNLVGYRTFVEVNQPQTQFIFRMKQEKYDGIMCGLFEADGGAWQIEAMDSIREYLTHELEGIEWITIIS